MTDKNNADKNNTDKNNADKNRKPSGVLAGNAAYDGTPGLAYVREYLDPSGPLGGPTPGDVCWIADSLNSGQIVACPRCHFLHLPARPFPLDPVTARHIGDGKNPPPVDACDVCVQLPEAARLPVFPQDTGAALDAAPSDLITERAARADVLFRLFMSGTDAADALVWAKMAEGRDSALSLAGEV